MITTMLLPDNIHPENSVYYNGAVVLELIQQYKCIELTELYILVKQKKNRVTQFCFMFGLALLIECSYYK